MRKFCNLRIKYLFSIWEHMKNKHVLCQEKLCYTLKTFVRASSEISIRCFFLNSKCYNFCLYCLLYKKCHDPGTMTIQGVVAFFEGVLSDTLKYIWYLCNHFLLFSFQSMPPDSFAAFFSFPFHWPSTFWKKTPEYIGKK